MDAGKSTILEKKKFLNSDLAASWFNLFSSVFLFFFIVFSLEPFVKVKPVGFCVEYSGMSNNIE